MFSVWKSVNDRTYKLQTKQHSLQKCKITFHRCKMSLARQLLNEYKNNDDQFGNTFDFNSSIEFFSPLNDH